MQGLIPGSGKSLKLGIATSVLPWKSMDRGAEGYSHTGSQESNRTEATYRMHACTSHIKTAFRIN